MRILAATYHQDLRVECGTVGAFWALTAISLPPPAAADACPAAVPLVSLVASACYRVALPLAGCPKHEQHDVSWVAATAITSTTVAPGVIAADATATGNCSQLLHE